MIHFSSFLVFSKHIFRRKSKSSWQPHRPRNFFVIFPNNSKSKRLKMWRRQAHRVHLRAMSDNDVIATQDAIYLIIWGRFPTDHQPRLVLLHCDVSGENRWHWKCDKKWGTEKLRHSSKAANHIKRLQKTCQPITQKWERESKTSEIFDYSLVCGHFLA